MCSCLSFSETIPRIFDSLHPKKIIYFSDGADGAASQYSIPVQKSKKLPQPMPQRRLWYVSWVAFFGHLTRKRRGLGGTVKRLAARVSLQSDQIMTLFDWACTNIQAANFGYCSNEDYQEKRFQNSRGTRKLHSFVPVSNTKVKVRNYSASKTVKEERVSSAKNDIPPNSIVGFVTCLCRAVATNFRVVRLLWNRRV